MNRYLFSLAVPPVAVCRYGCAGCCAAPIAVFWLAGLGSMLYGYLGGPLAVDGVSWYTIGLGAILWAIASIWAMITVHNVSTELCESRTNSLCRKTTPRLDESDPLDEVTKFTN